jgi:hypothetical protein
MTLACICPGRRCLGFMRIKLDENLPAGLLYFIVSTEPQTKRVLRTIAQARPPIGVTIR